MGGWLGELPIFELQTPPPTTAIFSSPRVRLQAKADVPPLAEDIVGGSWVRDERPFYDYTSNTCTGEAKPCGHYTQVVWGSSCAVGCALVSCSAIANAPIEGPAFLAVCHYGPAYLLSASGLL